MSVDLWITHAVLTLGIFGLCAGIHYRAYRIGYAAAFDMLHPLTDKAVAKLENHRAALREISTSNYGTYGLQDLARKALKESKP